MNPAENELDFYYEALTNKLKRVYQGSLYLTCRDLLGYKDINWETHGDLIRALEHRATLRKLIVMPRGSLKSSLGVVGYVIWRLINDPNERILIDSEIFTNSRNFIRELRSHFESDAFRKVFGDWVGDNWSEAEITVKARTKAYKEASVTAGGIGTVKVGQHYSIIIGDDLNSGNNSATPEARKKVIQHYQMNSAILDPGGTYVLIGTRYAVDDVYGHVLQNELGIKNVDEMFQLEYEFNEIKKGLL